MKYCTNCGQALEDSAAFCTNCGTAAATEAAAATPVAEKKMGQFNTIIKIFMIIGTVVYAWTLIPLIWCVPMCIHVFKRLDRGEEISMGMKICTFLFVNMVAGILLLLNDTKF